MSKNAEKGFSLVELIIVIFIIAILARIAIPYYANATKKTRDAKRLEDVTTLSKAVADFTADTAYAGTSVSTALCSGTTNPCSSSSYPQTANTKNTNGTGWILINLASSTIVALPNLPLDPTNNATYNYGYGANGTNWKITTKLESTDNASLMQNDGGSDNTKYEVGLNPGAF